MRYRLLSSQLRTLLAIAAVAILGHAAPTLAQSSSAGDTRPVLRIAVQALTTTGGLDPARETSNVATRIFGSLFDNLIDSDRQGDLSLRPGVMESWRRVDDRTIEFKLRRGVMFHNGDEMTAEDVAFSFGPSRLWGTTRPALVEPLSPRERERLAELPRDVPVVSDRFYPGFERMEVVDRYTVRWINRSPDVTLEGRLAREGAAIVSRRAFLESANWAAWSRSPVGTGPYKLRSFRDGVEAILEAHDTYWGGQPPFREIRFIVVPEVSVRVAGLLSGQFDIVSDLPPDQFRTIRADSRFDVVGGPILNHRLIIFDRNHPAMADARVRRALIHAVDTRLIAQSLWLGETEPAPGLQWEFYGAMFLPDWRSPDFDPALARRLLAEAGYRGEPIPYRVGPGYYTLQVATAQVLQEMWRAVGLNVTVEMRENWAQIYDRSTPRGIRDWSNTARFNDPVGSMNSQHCQNGGQQQQGEWTNAEFNRLCDLLETSTDMTARRAAFRRMLEIIEREDPGYMVLHRSVLHYAKRRDFGWTPSPTQSMDFRRENVRLGAAGR